MRAIVMIFVEEAFMVFLAKLIMTIMLVKMRFRRCFMETPFMRHWFLIKMMR
jgi:hypothetical protein